MSIFLSFLTNNFVAQDTCLYNLTLGISFPPVADIAQREFSKLHLDYLGVSKIRFAENWALREPTQGNFNWIPLDERINWASNNNYEIMLTIQSNAPEWACSAVQNNQSCVFNDNNDFKLYIDSLLQRYSGKINKIQFGNEWQSDYWYVGNSNDFIIANNILFNSVQEFSPSTQVVLGGFTTISLRFLAACNNWVSSFYDDDGNFYDSSYINLNCPLPLIQDTKNRIDSVLQFDQFDILVEQWAEYYYNFLDTISKPIVISEFGGPNMNYEPYSDGYQTNRLYQYIKKIDSLQIQEAYYFKLIEGTSNAAHVTSGLISDTNLTIKSAYYLFQTFNTCLTSMIKNELNKQINIFPNPASQKIEIRFNPNKIMEEQIQIFDIMGIEVLKVYLMQTKYIDISDLSNGLYFIQYGNYQNQRYKFVKE